MSRLLVSFVGTCLSRAEVMAILTAAHMTSMLSNVVERKDLLASTTVDLRLSRPAFSHKNIFLRLVSQGMAGVTIQTIQCRGRSLVQSAEGLASDFESKVACKD